jgi:hypothetical protein
MKQKLSLVEKVVIYNDRISLIRHLYVVFVEKALTKGGSVPVVW